MRRIWGSWTGRIGIVLVGGMTAAGVLSTVWTPYDPHVLLPSQRWKPISFTHPFGTDASGRDLFSLVISGAWTTARVVFLSTVIAAVIGMVLGILSAIAPRWIGEAMAHLIDVMIAIPALVLALVLVAGLGGSIVTISLAIGIAFGIVFARVIRVEAHKALTNDYIVAAHASGASTWRIAWRHVVPNIAPTIIVQLSLIAALTILTEAALSFLGLMPLATISWGRMLQDLQSTMTIHPLALVFPGIAVVLATLGFNLLGDGVREALDPQLKARGASAAIDPLLAPTAIGTDMP